MNREHRSIERAAGAAWLASLLGAAAVSCAGAGLPAEGAAVQPSREQILEQQKKGCAAGVLEDCRSVSVACPSRSCTEEEHLRVVARACELGEDSSCSWMLTEERVEPAAARMAWRKLCHDFGRLMPCHWLAERAIKGSTPFAVDWGEAFAAQQRICAMGEILPCREAAGLGLAPEKAEAQRDQLYELAVCKGKGRAECDARLATVYLVTDAEERRRFMYSGRSPPKPTPDDLRKGLSRLRSSCSQGYVEACADEGIAAYAGLLGPPRREAGFTLLEAACAGGAARGCVFLGRVHLAPGRHHDVKRAAAMLDKGCGADPACLDDAGNALASRQHLAEAAPFFERACDAHLGIACGDAGRVRLLRGDRGAKTVELLKTGCDAEGSAYAVEAACRAAASLTTGAERRVLLARGTPGPDVGDAMRASYGRSLGGHGSGNDHLLLLATGLTGGLLAIGALPSPKRSTGYGFPRDLYLDP